jgi:hypothetical protein
MENLKISKKEIAKIESLQSLLDFNEIESQEAGFMGSDEYPFPHVFKFQALAIRAMLANPEYSFSPIKNLKHIFSEELSPDAFPTLYESLDEIENLGDPEIAIELPNNYTKYYYIKINNEPAIYYEGGDGNSSTNFSFFGVIL